MYLGVTETVTELLRLEREFAKGSEVVMNVRLQIARSAPHEWDRPRRVCIVAHRREDGFRLIWLR